MKNKKTSRFKLAACGIGMAVMLTFGSAASASALTFAPPGDGGGGGGGYYWTPKCLRYCGR